ncbi:hypothetical protein AB0M28_23795 [Streptomyces sp. NPDC051940]|uniref:hypothetical protein n=1 Tax=Streptomyces sp. NPDC051940 TaxID=3155675 RepID=UPI003435987F
MAVRNFASPSPAGRTRVLVVAGAITGLLAGCSGGGGGLADKPADEIGRAAVTAMKSATSLTMRGAITPPTGAASRLRLSVSTTGDCSGTIEAVSPPSQVRVLVVDGASYMKPDHRYLVANAGGPDRARVTERKIAGRWLKLDDRSGADEFKGLCDLDELLAGLDPGKAGAKAEKGDEATVDGRRAIPITDRNGKQTTTAWVAAEGTPYILRLESRGGTDTGTITFSDFDSAKRPTSPAPKEYLEMARLNG